MDGSLSWNIRIMAGVREDDCEWEHGFHPLPTVARGLSSIMRPKTLLFR